MSQDLMQSLTEYANSGNGSIATAAMYLRDMEKCIKSGGSCPVKMMGLKEDETWDGVIKAAKAKLVYADPTGVGIKALSTDALEKDFHVEGAILYSEGVISTADEDRDGDIVETKSLVFVDKMPVLFQHMHSSPAGVMAGITEQSEKSATGVMAFLDTALGRDLSLFVKAGAMRYSIGFIPKSLEVLGTYVNGEGKEVPTGFRIKSAEVYETSAVSVPANAHTRTLRVFEKEFNALCDTYSGEKIEDDAVRSWAKSLFDIRPRVFKGAKFEKSVETPAGEAPAAETPAEVPAEEPVTKEFRSGKEKMFVDGGGDALSGSHEQVQSQLRSKLRKYMSLHDCDSYYPHLVATFADHCIVTCWDWDSEEMYSYRVEYSVSDEKVQFSGEPKQIKVEYSIVEKSVGESKVKAWKSKEQRTAKSEKAVAEAPQTTPESVRETKDPLLAIFGL